jgi:hypothetical protein
MALGFFALAGTVSAQTTPLAAIRDSNTQVKAVLDANNGSKMDANKDAQLKSIIG